MNTLTLLRAPAAPTTAATPAPRQCDRHLLRLDELGHCTGCAIEGRGR